MAVVATFVLHALTRADRRESLQAVRSGFADAREGRLGPRRDRGGFRAPA
jgi:hypothetical protein